MIIYLYVFVDLNVFKAFISCSVVDPDLDPDLVGSETYCTIRI